MNKTIFPKQVGAAVAASLCFLSLGQAQDNTPDRETNQATTTIQDSVLEGDVTGKIMPLKAFLASQTGGLKSLDKDAQYDDGGIQPLVLVVDGRTATGATTQTNATTDAATTTSTDTTTSLSERAYILVFQDDDVKDKAEKVAKEDRDVVNIADDATTTNATSHDQKRVKVSGERSYHGGVMAIMVREIGEASDQENIRNRTEVSPRTDSDAPTRTETDGAIDTESGNKIDDATDDN